jgi:hypothetical protein
MERPEEDSEVVVEDLVAVVEDLEGVVVVQWEKATMLVALVLVAMDLGKTAVLMVVIKLGKILVVMVNAVIKVSYLFSYLTVSVIVMSYK